MEKWYEIRVFIDMACEYENEFNTLAEAEKEVENIIAETEKYKQNNPEMSDAVFTLFLNECNDFDEMNLKKLYM